MFIIKILKHLQYVTLGKSIDMQEIRLTFLVVDMSGKSDNQELQ